MSKESGVMKNVMTVYCDSPKSKSGAHCWHSEGHNHSFDKCCWCNKSGAQIFGTKYGQGKEVPPKSIIAQPKAEVKKK